MPGAVEAAGAPEGTTITVRDLFYNTPARLKFMRKDSAETAAVNGLMQHLALSHPDISFKFIKDGAEALLHPRRRKAGTPPSTRPWAGTSPGGWCRWTAAGETSPSPALSPRP